MKQNSANSKKQYQKSVLWLLLLITIGILIIYFQFLFKGTPYLFWTSGSDTRDSYLMKYSGIVNKIVSGDTALWDFHSGMGSNVLMSQSIVFRPVCDHSLCRRDNRGDTNDTVSSCYHDGFENMAQGLPAIYFLPR